jgi:hypothetical protein
VSEQLAVAEATPTTTFDPEPGRWVQDDLRANQSITKGKFTAPELTTFHHRCCAILSRAFRTGIYNLPVKWEKAEFRGGSYPFTMVTVASHRGLSTWDFDHLTRLVIAAHEECIRVDLEPVSRGYIRIRMHPRQREGGMATRHPTIEQAVADWRAGARTKAGTAQ